MNTTEPFLDTDILDTDILDTDILDTDILDTDTINEFIEKTSILDSDNNIPEVNKESSQGELKITMDFMKMTLYIELKAPINSSNEISMSDIRSKIHSFGTHCENSVDWEKVYDIYSRIMFDGEVLPEQIIAEGKPVTFHIPEHIILKENIISRKRLVPDKNGIIDYHKVSPFILVNKNECIGNIIPEVLGSNGNNLLNEEIISPKKNINLYKTSRNVKVVNDKLYSCIDGAFKIIENNLIIDNVIEVSENVDYKTGDISFKGDIIINKTVREGFKVDSVGNIIVLESIEPTNIICGNNLTVNQGIIGKPDYKVIVKNDLYGRYTDNANIDCLGSIIISSGIINSNINTLGTLNVGEKAAIIGGTYRIQNGLIAGDIGNENGKISNIYLGIDFTIHDKIIDTQNLILKLEKSSYDLRIRLKNEKSKTEREKIKLLFTKYQDRFISLNNYSKSLLYRLNKNKNSTLTVLGTIWPKTYIEICQKSYLVDEELTHVKFSLDNINECIKIESI